MWKVPVTLHGLEVDEWSKDWYSLDVTNYVQSQLTDKKLTFELQDVNGTDRIVKLQSKENQNGSFLEIH
ncbi:hypothetical protein GLW08_10815 [Pontibacillus yanchengensis]|uniref:Uncharacterized protein n=2 Tax=Pontibacillus yanchengensis TaxID=462910 RepID=A0ACC7VFY1_9BACI|nr:hypothetical protein [Pontibacillus yanchengensis]MYL34358.1 hypothetical protein [Pontibacillus yanchengensis]MYL53826.1 hypothetical protein [Pontibacillus yanchengensis]